MKHSYRLISLILLFLAAVSVRAETLDCTAITSLPTVIITQGIYCLTGNLYTSMTSGHAITIQNNNITIDLNGFELNGLGAGDRTWATGIYAHHRKNITIKNGTVRGFYYGIDLIDDNPFTVSQGNVVEGIRADQNTYTAITVAGIANTINNNTVTNTGGSANGGYARGILIFGASAKVMNNDISNTYTYLQTTWDSGAIVTGISCVANYSLIKNNTVTNIISLIDHSTLFDSRAIAIYSSTGVLVQNNTLANTNYGIYFDASTGKYFNNLTFDVTTPFTGGTPIGNNNN